MPDIIKCNSIEYRKGFIEVKPNIHPGHINLEFWKVHVDANITDVSIRDYEFPDAVDDAAGNPVEPVTDHGEMELNLEQAKAFVVSLQAAIAVVENK